MICSLSIDLDNKWAYLRTASHPSWESWPSYFHVAVPRIRSVMEEIDLKLTVFVVGRDLENEKDANQIGSLAFDGHEIANHSYDHEPWLHLYDDEDVRYEICRTGQLIKDRFGKAPRGFRGPGFSDSAVVHRVLQEHGYRYCASAFPSSVGPLARAFYLAKTGLKRDTAEHQQMFGKLTDMMKPNRPYRLAGGCDSSLWMVPVTVQPFTRLPVHFTYLFFLSQYSTLLARSYFMASMLLCRLTRTPPSVLLHPLDFLSVDDEPELAFFPGMRLSAAKKRRELLWYLSYLKRTFEVVTMEEQIARLSPPSSVSCEPSMAEIRSLAHASAMLTSNEVAPEEVVP